MSCSLDMVGAEFGREEIEAAARAGRLLSVEVELNSVCTFRCRYCYKGAQEPDPGELGAGEIRAAVGQARELGARKVVLLGGEPMLHPEVLGLCADFRGQGLAVEIFTNGTNVSAAAARRLFALGVTVALKFNSREPAVQDALAGRPGAHRVIRSAFERLRAAGYPSAGARMACSTVICRQNLAELPALWRWLRDQDIVPYFEMITPQGRAAADPTLHVSAGEAQRLFEEIARIDRAEYGRAWEPQPPLVGNRCLRHLYSCLVTSRGDVFPCVGVTLPLGNVRAAPLADILGDSEVLADLRRHRETIRGPCRTCTQAPDCYGCRGAAFQATGNYLASDPMCWRVDPAADPGRLPMPAGPLVPHAPPMRMADTLEAVGERTASVAYTVSAANPFAGADGALAPSAFLEIMAQAAAALNGFRRRADGDPRGFLVGARGLEVLAPARVGDRLDVRVAKRSRYGGFGVVEAEVRRGGSIVARGEIKVWSAD